MTGSSVNRNSWGGDPESLGQIDLPITLETSHYLFNTRGGKEHINIIIPQYDKKCITSGQLLNT